MADRKPVWTTNPRITIPMPTLHLKCSRCQKQVTGCYFVGQEAVCKDCYRKQDDQIKEEIAEQLGWFEFTIASIALLIVFLLTLWAAISGSLESRH